MVGAAMADDADRLAHDAYTLYTGRGPDLYHPAYDSDAFRWDGCDSAADALFKTERLRLHCVAARRARELCTAALASRKAKQRIAEGGPIAAVIEQFDRAVKAAGISEALYFANYEDDYRTGDDGTRLRKTLEATRSRFLADCGGETAVKAVKADRRQPVPEAVRKAIKRRCAIDWEKQTDVLPENPRADKPGVYLSMDLGLSREIDYYCAGAVFTVRARGDDGAWRTIFRRALLKRDAGWQHWDVPLGAVVDKAGAASPRLTTDACSRAIDREAPTWKWGYWGQPRVVRVTAGGQREVQYDLIEHIDRSKAMVRLDATGKRRPFDGEGEDSSGATFKAAAPGDAMPGPVRPAIAAFVPHRDGNSGVTVAEFQVVNTAVARAEDRKPASRVPLPPGARLVPDLETSIWARGPHDHPLGEPGGVGPLSLRRRSDRERTLASPLANAFRRSLATPSRGARSPRRRRASRGG